MSDHPQPTDLSSPDDTAAHDHDVRLESLRADATRSRQSAATSSGDFREQLLGLASDIELHVAHLETSWRKPLPEMPPREPFHQPSRAPLHAAPPAMDGWENEGGSH